MTLRAAGFGLLVLLAARVAFAETPVGAARFPDPAPALPPEPAPDVAPTQQPPAATAAPVPLVPPAGYAPMPAPSYGPRPIHAAQPKTERVWYGWQILATDSASLAFFYLAAKGDDPTPGYLGLGAYALGGPTVHLVHGQGGKAAASLGLRVGLPAAGVLTGALLFHEDCSSKQGESEWCGMGQAIGMGLGLLLGAGTAMVIDTAALAREDVPALRTRPERGKIRLVPSVAAVPGRFSAGVVGSF